MARSQPACRTETETSEGPSAKNPISVAAGGERARAQHFPAGQGGERFCSLSRPYPKEYKAGVNNNSFEFSVFWKKKLSQNVTTLELY